MDRFDGPAFGVLKPSSTGATILDSSIPRSTLICDAMDSRCLFPGRMMVPIGLRVSEAGAMRRSYVNLDCARLWIPGPRNGLSVEQPLAG